MSQPVIVTFAGIGCLFCLVFGLPLGSVQADDLPKPKKIRLSEVYSTSIQAGLKDLVTQLKEDSPERRAYSQIVEALYKRKTPPCMAVVRADSVQQAVRAAARWVEAKQPAAKIFGPDEASKGGNYWLFVYINHESSTPPVWEIQRPTITEKIVRFSYTKPDGEFAQTTDFSPYIYLVPLGEIAEPTDLKAELVFLEKKIQATFSK